MHCSNCGALVAGGRCAYCGNELKDDSQPPATVTVHPNYCECGNVAEFRCQICQEQPLCATCDVMALDWSGTYQEYGFLIARGSETPFGPVLYKGDIVPLLKGRPHNLYHLCNKCLAAGAPAAYDAIASGGQCEYPNCGSAPTGRCSCCRIPFCRSHFVWPETSLDTGTKETAARNDASRIEPPPWRSLDSSISRPAVSLHASLFRDGKRTYRVRVTGLCEMCVIERTQAARRKIYGRAQSHRVTFQEKSGEYSTRVEIPFRVNPGLEDWREWTIIKLFDRMVGKILREIEVEPGPCRRDRYLGSPAGGESRVGFTYRTVDNRGDDSRRSLSCDPGGPILTRVMSSCGCCSLSGGTVSDSRIDTTRPSIARVYDYWLGGKDNFAVDRTMADEMEECYPGTRQMAVSNRRFLVRAVTWAAAQGIRQFLDLGAGLPTVENTHQTARAVTAEARVCYVDIDPVAELHASALLAGSPGIVAARADLTKPDEVLADPRVRTVIDPAQPLAVILAMVLHFLSADEARRTVAEYAAALAPGSYIIVSVLRCDDLELWARGRPLYTAGNSRNHSRDEVTSFLSGLELVPPGLVSARSWRGGMPDPGLKPGAPAYVLAAVARKR
jgi:SAM-dependent methyltransferase